MTNLNKNKCDWKKIGLRRVTPVSSDYTNQQYNRQQIETSRLSKAFWSRRKKYKQCLREGKPKCLSNFLNIDVRKFTDRWMKAVRFSFMTSWIIKLFWTATSETALPRTTNLLLLKFSQISFWGRGKKINVYLRRWRTPKAPWSISERTREEEETGEKEELTKHTYY